MKILLFLSAAVHYYLMLLFVRTITIMQMNFLWFLFNIFEIFMEGILSCTIFTIWYINLADDAYRYGSLDKISAFSLKSSCRNLKAWYVNLHFLFNNLSGGCQKVHIVQKLSKTCWPILKGGTPAWSSTWRIWSLLPVQSCTNRKSLYNLERK